MRYWVFSPDASVEQTIRIEKFKVDLNNQINDVILGKRSFTDYDYSKELLRYVLELIEDREVIIPFYSSVYGILDKTKLRIRGDYDKIKLLLEMYGLLNARNIPSIKLDKKTVYVLTPEKAIEILQLARTFLVYMTKDVEGRDYDLVKVFREIGTKPPTSEEDGTRIDVALQVRIADQLGKKRGTILKELNDWEARGWVEEINRRPQIYMLKKSLDEMEKDMSGYADLDDPKLVEELRRKMIKEANEYFKEREINFQFNPTLIS